MTDTNELEEERRLAYVGITRAQQRLYLTHAWSRTLFGQTNYNPPSRFLGEIPTALLDAKESETRAQRASRYGARRPAGAAQGGYTVVGLPGRTDAVEVTPGWTPPAPAGVPRREAPSIVAGDTVQHERWGEGVVVSTSGYGDDAEATIRFGEVGEKRVLLSYAPITKIG
jgi:DNA helicase-2/ATP-dependent DNA helicase PcrA